MVTATKHQTLPNNLTMRYYQFIFFLLLSCLQSFASESYKVNASSGLNVRDYPSNQAKVIGLLDNESKVEVSNIYEGWGQIKYKNTTGYVSMKYLVYDTPEPVADKTPTRAHGSSWLPITIMVLAFAGGYLIGHDYFWIGIGISVLNLLLVWYQLDATPWPLWFVTEKGVGLGWMVINMFLMFLTISMIWIEITAILSWTGIDDIAIWGAKGLFIIRLFSPVTLLMTLLILWIIGYAIYISIRLSNYMILVGAAVGAVVIAIIVNGGGALCTHTFRGLDLVILIAGVIPTVLASFCESSSSSHSISGESGLRQYEVYDPEDNRKKTLTQISKYSGCEYRDEDGKDWEYYDGGFHKRRY